MKKIGVLFLLIFLVSISFVSASWLGDFFEITGKVAGENDPMICYENSKTFYSGNPNPDAFGCSVTCKEGEERYDCTTNKTGSYVQYYGYPYKQTARCCSLQSASSSGGSGDSGGSTNQSTSEEKICFDENNDGVVDEKDADLMMGRYKEILSGSEFDSCYDFDKNGVVNGLDISSLKEKIEKLKVEKSFCEDSDGGINYFEKGTLNTSVSNGTIFEDYCLNEFSLIERYCDSVDENKFTIEYGCEFGCEEGVCLDSPKNPIAEINSCEDLVKLIKENKFSLKGSDGNTFVPNWNYSYEFANWINGEEKIEVHSAGWYLRKYDSYYSPSFSVYSFSSSDNALEYINELASEGLCKTKQYGSDYVYVCSYYDGEIREDNKETQVFWVNGKKLFRFEGSLSLDGEQKETQKRLELFMNKLKNNQYEWANPQLNWKFEKIVRDSLSACSSDVEVEVNEDNETCESCWECKIEPVVCPPHGYQTKICVDRCCEENSKEQVQYCSPGICSGCMVPRWIGSKENSCIPYGFRFAEEENDKDNEILEEGNFNDYALEILSDSEAVLSLKENEFKNISYNLKLDEKTYIEFPEMEKEISAFYIIPKEINSEKNYVDLIVYAERSFNAYCDFDGEIKRQKTMSSDGSWANCQNNYECESNVCSSGECIEVTSLLQKASGFKSLGVRVLCTFTDALSIQEYDSCIVEYLQ